MFLTLRVDKIYEIISSNYTINTIQILLLAAKYQLYFNEMKTIQKTMIERSKQSKLETVIKNKGIKHTKLSLLLLIRLEYI